MEEIKKSCTNCRHYIEHYTWCANRFCETNCGHCAVYPPTKKLRKLLPLKNGCAKWESRVIEIAERKTYIESELRNMSKRVECLIQYFEREENGE